MPLPFLFVLFLRSFDLSLFPSSASCSGSRFFLSSFLQLFWISAFNNQQYNNNNKKVCNRNASKINLLSFRFSTVFHQFNFNSLISFLYTFGSAFIHLDQEMLFISTLFVDPGKRGNRQIQNKNNELN